MLEMARRSPWLEPLVVEPGLEAGFLDFQASVLIILFIFIIVLFIFIIIIFISSHSLRFTCNALLTSQPIFLLYR